MPVDYSGRLAVALVGLLMYVLASNAKVVEVGRILFFCGVLVAVWLSGAKTLRIG